MEFFDKAVMKLFQVGAASLDRAIGTYAAPNRLAADPYPEYARARKKGSVVRSYSAGGWIVLGFDEVRQALYDRRLGVDPRNSPLLRTVSKRVSPGRELRLLTEPTLLNLDPPDHTRLRKLTRQGFLHKFVRSLEPQIRGLVEEALSTVQTGAPFDLVETLARPLPANVICDILGVPREDRRMFQEWSEFIAKYARSFDYGALRASDALYNKLLDYLEGIVEHQRDKPRDNLIGELIGAEELGDKLTTREVYTTCALLLIAGHETTTRAIGNAVWLLLSHPEQLQALRADRGLLSNAVEETLRFESPVQFTTRFALEDIELGGRRIKRHAMVSPIIGAANRDPRANPTPDRFDITRAEVRHVGFGYGPHLCLGAELARLETRVALEMLFDRFPALALEDASPHWGDSSFVRGLDDLILTH